ncbi:hypothetical protein V2W45_1346281 [Cenococcum geophilum]
MTLRHTTRTSTRPLTFADPLSAMPPFGRSAACPDDNAAIASRTSLFTRLQFSALDTSSLANAMTPRIAENMKKPRSRFITMRD